MSVAGVESVLQEYRAVVLGHPRLREAVRGVRSSLAPGLSPQIVALVGPTGVGKSTVLEVVGRELAAEASTVRTARKLPAAVVKVMCLPPGNKGFEFGQLHWRLLSQAAGGECPDDHICPDEEAKRLKKGGTVRQGQGSVDEQRVGVLTFLRQRGVRAVVFDEAQYVTRIRGARTQADQLDVVKDCVDRSGLPHVLAGTYELNALFSANEQAVRRLRVHHFRPYFLDMAEDREAFVQILGELLLALPLPDPGRSLRALEPHLRAICVRSLGCVGILKDWLTDGLRTVVEEGGGDSRLVGSQRARLRNFRWQPHCDREDDPREPQARAREGAEGHRAGAWSGKRLGGAVRLRWQVRASPEAWSTSAGP